jgi:hypothetical protein
VIRISTLIVIAPASALTLGIALFASAQTTQAAVEDNPTLAIVWPKDNSVIALGDDPERSIGVVVTSNFTLLVAMTSDARRSVV